MKDAGGESGSEVAGDSIGATCSIGDSIGATCSPGDVMRAFSGGSRESSSTAGGCAGNSLGSRFGTSTAGNAMGRVG